jgi:hypothetical protein
MQITPEIIAGLELARKKLADLSDPSSDRCHVGATDGLHEFGPRCECCGAGISDATIKDAVRQYLEMWTLFPFDAALAAINEEATTGELSYLAAVEAGTAAFM